MVYTGKWDSISIRNLNFSYKNNIRVLKNLDLKICRGQKIAFVGESGSGKSTLLNLLNGLYTVTDQYIIINSRIRMPFNCLVNETALIPQVPEIFENTLKFNISLNSDYSKEKMNEVLELTQLKPVIGRLKNGLDTDIREKGINLSGGEIQRLALARGLFSIDRTSLLLLDEPTSSVDIHNEKLIYQKIFVRYEKNTIISAVHHLHLLMFFDQIIVFKNGRIIESGSFEKLISYGREFCQLWNKYNNNNLS